MARPPIYARGLYELDSPWTADASTVYVCNSIRSFDDLLERNIDPFTAYYEPKGLTRSVYEQDADAATTIVTLISEDESEVIYVPDSYIRSFPDQGEIPYHHVVMSVDFGALPEYLGLDFMKQQLATAASEVLGTSANVELHIAPSTGVVTPDEHNTLEAARQANISRTQTDQARLLECQEQTQALVARIRDLESFIDSKGLINEITS